MLLIWDPPVAVSLSCGHAANEIIEQVLVVGLMCLNLIKVRMTSGNERGAANLPFPFETVGEQAAQERTEREDEGDGDAIFQALDDARALRGQQLLHPAAEAIEADDLKEVEDGKHDGVPPISRLPDLGISGAAALDHARLRRRQRGLGLGRDPRLDLGRDAVGFIWPAVLGEQRGDSGTSRLIHQTKRAPSTGTATTQRQPAIPRGSIGTSCQDRKVASGTATNWIA
jgi:hypothetical protein